MNNKNRGMYPTMNNKNRGMYQVFLLLRADFGLNSIVKPCIIYRINIQSSCTYITTIIKITRKNVASNLFISAKAMRQCVFLFDSHYGYETKAASLLDNVIHTILYVCNMSNINHIIYLLISN